jgi:hypothetical protein
MEKLPMFRIYIWIDGVDFDPDKFQNTLDEALKGTVALRKRIRDGIVENSGKYWKSEVLEVTSGHPEEKLNDLLIRFKSELLSIKNTQSARIVVELVAEYDDPSLVRGFFFSEQTIQLLAEVGAALDIDVVRPIPPLSDFPRR